MKKKPPKKPSGIKFADGDRYVPCVMQVIDSEPDGRPRLLRMLYEDESVEIGGGEKFIIPYVDERSLKMDKSKD